MSNTMKHPADRFMIMAIILQKSLPEKTNSFMLKSYIKTINKVYYNGVIEINKSLSWGLIYGRKSYGWIVIKG